MNALPQKNTAGFTMIELLVAIGIFGIFITIVTGIFAQFMLVERHSIAEGQLITDLRSAMESLVKEARTGYGSTYNVTADGTEVAFRNQAGECVSYRVHSDPSDPSHIGIFQRAAVGNIGGDCIAGTIDDNFFSPLTGSQTNIDSIHFNTVIASTSGNTLLNQGVITVSMEAKSSTSDILPVQLENTITSRQMAPYVSP